MSDAKEDVGREEIRNSDVPSIDQLIEGSNWEARLAVARKKRAAVLAKKQIEVESTAPKTETGEPVQIIKATQPLIQVVEKVPLDGRAPSIAPLEPVLTSLIVKEKRAGRSVGLLLVACCAALGFGVSLGAGIMIATGLVSTTQLTGLASGQADNAIEDIAVVAAPPIQEIAASEVLPVAVATSQSPPAEISDNTRSPIDTPSSPEALVAKTADDLSLILPRSEASLSGSIGVPTGLTFVSSEHQAPLISISSARPAVEALLETSNLIVPNVPSKPAILFLAQVSSPTRLKLAGVPTTTESRLSPPSATAMEPSPKIDVVYTVPGMATQPNKFDRPIIPRVTSPVVAVTTELTLLPPRDDTWQGVRTRPAEPLSLATLLGLAGIDSEEINVKLHAPNGMPQEELDVQALRLEQTGFALAAPIRPGFNISRSHLRYYNSSDREVADAIASVMGFEVRDFTSTDAPSGLIEIWLEGRATAQAAAPRRQTRAPSVDPLSQLRNSIASQLRNGEHL